MTQHRDPATALDPATARGIDRRTVVTGTGVAALGVLAAACSTAVPTAAGSTGTAPAGTAPTVSAPSGSAPAGAALGATTDVPVGGGVVFADRKVVVTQPTAGTYVGLSAVCTHKGCLVTKVAEGTIQCPCHGSRYKLDGSVANGPATKALASAPVTVQGTAITLA